MRGQQHRLGQVCGQRDGKNEERTMRKRETLKEREYLKDGPKTFHGERKINTRWRHEEVQQDGGDCNQMWVHSELHAEAIKANK